MFSEGQFCHLQACDALVTLIEEDIKKELQ
jgi:hypothetical protein